MAETLGDIRETENPSLEQVHESLRTLGYVVARNANIIGLDPDILTTLPGYADSFTWDQEGDPANTRESETIAGDHTARQNYGEKCPNRNTVRGIVDYELAADGSSRLARDYSQVAIPIKRNGAVEPRIVPGKLQVLGDPVLSGWLKGALSLIPPGEQQGRGSVTLNYIETGSNVGDGSGAIARDPHQEGEAWLATLVEQVDGDGAVTTLFSQVEAASSETPGISQSLREVASFRLGVGDIAVVRDTELWHSVSDIEGSRRALVVVFNTPRTNQWLRDFYET